MQNDPPFVPRGRSGAGVHYRLYFLNDLGHISKSHEYFADDDTAAIKVADAWREGRRMELWQSGRIVKRWHINDRD